MLRYSITVFYGGEDQYLYNHRVLLRDPALAKTFSSRLLARRYFKASSFKECRFQVVECPCDEPETDFF